MTIQQAIDLADDLKPNQIEKVRKIEWLNRLDEWIWREIMCRREKRPDTPDAFTPYTLATDGDTELLIQPPFEDTYRFWLETQIDLVNEDFDLYLNSNTLYQEALGRFTRYWYRNHPMKEPERSSHLRF